jgi:glycosyltransferase involved in cell wall biosynthesis
MFLITLEVDPAGSRPEEPEGITDKSLHESKLQQVRAFVMPTTTTKTEQQPGLSACMIVKNEEEMLPRCLASIKDHVDELVIVDTGSTDRTVEIAESFGARVYHHPWQNDFSLHRNQSISYARGKWIFIIDADEEFIPPEQRSLGDELALAEQKGCDALVMRVENSCSGGRDRVVADSIRIFLNGETIRYEGIVHNNLTGVAHAGLSLSRIIHYGYDTTREAALKKFERTAALLQKQIDENPHNATAHMYLACSHASLDRHDDALREALAAIDLVELREISDIIFLRAYYTAARALILMKRFEKALDICRKGMARFGDQVDLLAAEVMIFFETNDWDAVLDAGYRYRAALERYRKRNDGPTLVNVATFGDEWKICGWMGVARYRRGDTDSAETLFHASMDLSPDRREAARQIGLSLISLGDLDRSRPYLGAAHLLLGNDKDSRVTEALLKLAVLKNDQALKERSIGEAIALGDNSDDWRRWISQMADFSIKNNDPRSALMLFAAIVAENGDDLQARLKLAHILVFHNMIEQAVTHCDGLLRILDLPRNQTLESLSDLADLFLKIGDELDSRGEPNLAAIARDIQQQLRQPARTPGRQLQ